MTRSRMLMIILIAAVVCVVSAGVGAAVDVTDNNDATNKTITVLGDPTYVSGIISANTTWTLTGSPYIVTGNILVENGVELTIESGVLVKFDDMYYLRVDGSLGAQGTPDNLITFTSNKTSPNRGDWDKIYFTSTSTNSTMSYCNVEYGTCGIECSQSSPKINNNIIQNNSYYGLRLYGSSSTVNNNILQNNGNGVDLSSPASDIAIENNTIAANNYYGISLGWDWDNKNIYIKNNSIFQNSRGIHGGHWSSSVAISSNNITNNSWCGIELDWSSSVLITNNNILNNGEYGVCSDSGSGIEIHYNNLYGHTTHDVKCGRDDINATYNWWGCANGTLIDQHIYDYYDDFNLGKVIYEPFLVVDDPHVLTVTATPSSVTVNTPTDVVFNVTSEGSAVEGATVMLSGVFSNSSITGADGTVTIEVNATSTGTINVIATKTSYVQAETTVTAAVEHDPADTNHDCVVDMMELMAHISKWKSGEVGMMELMTSIGRWKLGTGGYC
jgi:parallel beta-helix repeat protein